MSPSSVLIPVIEPRFLPNRPPKSTAAYCVDWKTENSANVLPSVNSRSSLAARWMSYRCLRASSFIDGNPRLLHRLEKAGILDGRLDNRIGIVDRLREQALKLNWQIPAEFDTHEAYLCAQRYYPLLRQLSGVLKDRPDRFWGYGRITLCNFRR